MWKGVDVSQVETSGSLPMRIYSVTSQWDEDLFFVLPSSPTGLLHYRQTHHVLNISGTNSTPFSAR